MGEWAFIVKRIRDVTPTQPLRVVIGAGRQRYPGWISTNVDELDLRRREDWVRAFAQRPADAFLCEHVWEHLTEGQGRAAAALCREFLRPGGYIRCAVPDANFRNDEYQAAVRVGGPGAKDHPAADHQIVYDYRLFTDVFAEAGFVVDLLEYCDEAGRFHYHGWSPDDGPIYRSLLTDHRNRDGHIGFVSLIIDAVNPA